MTGKRVLCKHRYPPAKQEKAAQTLLDQAHLLTLACAPYKEFFRQKMI